MLAPPCCGCLLSCVLLQWGTAFAQCLRPPAPAEMLHLDICTSEGLLRVAVPAGDPAEHDPHEGQAGFCPACAEPSALSLPTPIIVLAMQLAFGRSVETPPHAAHTAQMRDDRPPPRAPPTA